MMLASIKGKKIAIISGDYFEESELTEPLAALQDAGATVDVIAPHDGEIKGLKHTDPGQSVTVDKTLDEMDPSKYDAIVFPGGAVNADELRMNDKVRQVIRSFMDAGKVVAAICHAPWAIASAGRSDGKQMTSFPTIQDDIRNAGGEWVNEEVVIDQNLITSRKPDDIPAFNNAIIQSLAAA
jgi:protease I